MANSSDENTTTTGSTSTAETMLWEGWPASHPADSAASTHHPGGSDMLCNMLSSFHPIAQPFPALVDTDPVVEPSKYLSGIPIPKWDVVPWPSNIHLFDDDHMATTTRAKPHRRCYSEELIGPASKRIHQFQGSSLIDSCSSSSSSSAAGSLSNSLVRGATMEVFAMGPALNTNGKPRARRGSATDPQSVYARHRREKINERLKILQHLVPNGSKVDIVTMLDEAVHYVQFLQLQVKLLKSDKYWIHATPNTYKGIDLTNPPTSMHTGMGSSS